MSVLDTRNKDNPCCVTRRLPRADASHLEALAGAVIAAAGQVEEKMLAPSDGQDGKPVFEPKTLLAILTFCYAWQIYGSAEVAARLRRDDNFRRLCKDEIPDASALRRFRTQNRLALNFCLRAALRFLAEEKVEQGLLTKVREDRLAEEASRRITTAMFTDSLELDRDPSEASTLELFVVAKGRA